jgi:kynureninase
MTDFPPLDTARRRDADDPLAEYRDAFAFPETDSGDEAIYLCGNSLGLQPESARDVVDRELDKWADRAVDGHFSGEQPWESFHSPLSEPMAEIVGARPDEVVLMNTLTVNLHLMMVSFYRPTPERPKILMERSAFPSDRYALVSQIEHHGFDPDEALIEIGDGRDGSLLDESELLEAIEHHGDELALVMIGGLQYYTGQALDLEPIVEAGHEVGAKVGFDLAHAVGNVELDLHDWNADFAVWCTYKYLNGGPGAIAGAFVHDRYAEDFELPRFAGWWGNDPETRFDMKPEFEPQSGAGGWQLSNAPILSLAPLEASLALFERAGMGRLREKSVELTEYMLELLDTMPSESFEVLTPRDPERRGAQLSLRLAEGGRELFEAIRDRGVVCDYRKPSVVRVAPAPMYNSFEDVWHFCRILRDVVSEGRSGESG